MKKNKLLLLLFLIIFFPLTVQAKNEELTCNYSGTYIDKDDKSQNVTIQCTFYDDNSQNCSISTSSFSQPISNWVPTVYTDFNAKEYYMQNKSCFPHMVFVDDGAWVNQYQIYAFDTYIKANEAISNRRLKESLDSYRFPKTYSSIMDLDSGTGTEVMRIRNKIDSYLQTLEDWNTRLKVCRDNNENLNWVEKDKCNVLLQQYYRDINKWNQEIDDAINNRKISENDSKVQEFKQSFEKFKIDIGGFELGNLNCSGIFSGEFGAILKQILNIIKFLVPAIIIVMSVIDFIKALASQSQDELKKSANKLVKRIIIGILIFVLPTLLEFLLKIAGIEFGVCALG